MRVVSNKTDRGGVVDEFLSLGNVQLLHLVLLKLLLTFVQQQTAEVDRLTGIGLLGHVQLSRTHHPHHMHTQLVS